MQIKTETITEDNFLQILLSLNFEDGLAVIDDILRDDNFWPSEQDKENIRRFEQMKKFEAHRRMFDPCDSLMNRVTNPRVEDYVEDIGKPDIPHSHKWGKELRTLLRKYYSTSMADGQLNLNGYRSRRFIMNNSILIERIFSGLFYKQLVKEINELYKYGFYLSVLILCRKLFENIIIDFLKKKFKDEKSLYLNEERGPTLGFNDLVKSLKDIRKKLSDDRRIFDTWISNIQLLWKASNASAHSIFIIPQKEDIDKLRIAITLETFLTICEDNDITLK